MLQQVNTVWTQSVSPSDGNLDVEGYTRYNTGGCIRRSELGITSGESLQECADGCNADATCVSFEYLKGGTACQRSTTCKDFSLTVNNPTDPYYFFLKNVSCMLHCWVTC